MTPQDNRGSLPLTSLLADQFPKRREMTWHDQLVWLLHLGAALEHALMVQYLYAAYSLGGKQVPPEYRPKVKEWQESILAVAREEMGHLITVQNVLTFLGAGFSLNRDQFPWAIEWFDIEPFCMGSLACYVNAEMPESEDFPERKEIGELVKQHLKKDALPVHPVAAIYRQIMTLLADTERIPESALQPQTYSLQASWDEWGRGYKPAPRPLDAAGNLVGATAEVQKQAQFDSHVLIYRVATRTEALAALDAISLQGEGVEDSKTEGEWTHFRRFIKIYREFKKIQSSDWSPAAQAAINPNTNPDPLAPCPDGYISCDRTRNWAVLLNVRYWMLFRYLAHTFQIDPAGPANEPNVRAMLMHRVFGEMYQLKTLSGKLFQMPLRDVDADPRTPDSVKMNAGPPFELPSNTRLPVSDVDCWCLHRDSIVASRNACNSILSSNPTPDEREYIKTLVALDEKTEAWIVQILAGMNSTMRYDA
ncbi:MAG: ferritin-like domain-containing protein [Terracidiphilus sp.]|jgi:hypothetical protein